MKTVGIISNKGGTGRSTLAANLATSRTESLCKSALLDLDRTQQTLVRWGKQRWRREGPIVLGYPDTETPARAVERVRRNRRVSLLIIDTPALLTQSVVEALARCDLLIAPYTTSDVDLWGVRALADLAELLGIRPLFVLNKAARDPEDHATRTARDWLRTHGDLAESAIGQDPKFQKSMAKGRGVLEHDDRSRASAEVRALSAEVERELRRPRSVTTNPIHITTPLPRSDAGGSSARR